MMMLGELWQKQHWCCCSCSCCDYSNRLKWVTQWNRSIQKIWWGWNKTIPCSDCCCCFCCAHSKNNIEMGVLSITLILLLLQLWPPQRWCFCCSSYGQNIDDAVVVAGVVIMMLLLIGGCGYCNGDVIAWCWFHSSSGQYNDKVVAVAVMVTRMMVQLLLQTKL